ncbi:hypothetical protein C0991_006341, partial [Blastosporella zonata]
VSLSVPTLSQEYDKKTSDITTSITLTLLLREEEGSEITTKISIAEDGDFLKKIDGDDERALAVIHLLCFGYGWIAIYWAWISGLDVNILGGLKGTIGSASDDCGYVGKCMHLGPVHYYYKEEAGEPGALDFIQIAIHLSEISPPEYRALFPGLAYQVGNMITSASAQIEATAAENNTRIIDGKIIPNYEKAQAILIGVATAFTFAILLLGPE